MDNLLTTKQVFTTHTFSSRAVRNRQPRLRVQRTSEVGQLILDNLELTKHAACPLVGDLVGHGLAPLQLEAVHEQVNISSEVFKLASGI